MLKKLLFHILLWIGLGIAVPGTAQTTGNCLGVEQPIMKGDVFFNYGAASDAFSVTRRSSYSIGQTVVGTHASQSNLGYQGYWGRLFVPPLPPGVTATQGELLDRIQISWEPDPLGAQPTEGYKLFRDGVFLALVDKNTRNYNDFNVIAGKPYVYAVAGRNQFGDGTPGTALGFQVPNGVVTGWVQTLNGQPVPNALVSLTPLQGFSARFGPTDGAAAVRDTGTTPFMPGLGEDWTISLWIRTDAATANAQVLRLAPFALYVRARSSASGQEGIEVAQSPAGAPAMQAVFPDSSKNGWHHVAVTYDGGTETGRLYLDGALQALSPLLPVPQADSLFLGAITGLGGWQGRLDEVRIYHQRLDELDFGAVMTGTASEATPGLSHYWKLDEEKGERSFDILRRHRLVLCGASFDTDRPDVRTAALTNEQGYYRIQGVSYGTGTTFLAQPRKDFYMYRALRFVRDEGDYAALPDFPLGEKSTIELWVNGAGPDGVQSVLAKKWAGNDFRLQLAPNGTDNDVQVYLNGVQATFGTLGMGYQHLAFTIARAGTNATVTAYRNGVPFGAPQTFASVTGNWSDTTQLWYLGARGTGSGPTDHFGGLIDELAVYDTTLSQAQIQQHFAEPRDMQERLLRVYFPLNEGFGNVLNNVGSILMPAGTNAGAEWTAFAPRQVTEPHEFSPATRQVTLNPSVTSVDQVDFTDRSTIAVSGFVRFKNTDCFQPNVEILVNGAPFSPRIFTDSTGKFTIDFEPGVTATLTPVFEDHTFVPAQYAFTNLTTPIAGVLFSNTTVRTISGQLAGGLCRLPVIRDPGTPQGTVATVKIRSANGCLERQLTIDNPDGNYQFLNVPPLEQITVAVSEHSDPDVKNFFQVLGGATVNLTKADTVIDFIYFSEPQVQLTSGLLPISPNCPTIVLNEGDLEQISIKLVEPYLDEVCPLDTASFRIINFLNEQLLDTTMSNGVLLYKFRVGDPNPVPPYSKTIQIIGKSLAGREASLTREVVITGIRNKENTFTTMMPQIPTLVLRDPPGDGSSAFLEQGQRVCKTTTIQRAVSNGNGGFLNAQLIPTVETLIFAVLVEVQPVLGLDYENEVTYTRLSDTTFQTCSSFSQRISTSDSEDFIGSDVYVGEGINLIFGFADKVTFNDTICQPAIDVIVNVEPGTFATSFVYSEDAIKNQVMRYLDSLSTASNVDSASAAQYLESRQRWQAILDLNKHLKDSAQLVRNVSFDAGVVLEYSETSDTATNVASGNDTSNSNVFTFTGGVYLNNAGAAGGFSATTGSNITRVNDDGTESGVTVGYTLADDDQGDAFTVDVAMDPVYKTPVFRLKAGQSSCPWEEGTAHRDATSLEFRNGSGPVANNVPANEPAVFLFNLGNLSATVEDRTYVLNAGPESNPHGARIFVNGAPLNQPLAYNVPYGQSIPITLEIERGPIEYDYDSLEVAFYSECEDEPEDTILYSAHYLSVHFIRPCSEVDVEVPQQDWVIFPDPLTPPGVDDNLLRITASGYDTSNTDFQLIRMQYRRRDGDGTWINITGPDGHERYNPHWPGTPPPGALYLQPGFTQFYWQTDGLSDGPYEIRAVAVCSGASTDKPGFSDVIQGRIERQPPALLGVPEPSDGVYQVGDEISFTFNKNINCSQLIVADQQNANNVGLYDATTGQLIDIDVSCSQNKIVIDPNFQNVFFENRILRAELHSIEDLTGNESTYFEWEFYVDRNELAWLTDSIGMTKFEDENKTVTASIHNRGGYPVPFTIEDLPAWVHVVPTAGTLAPNEIRPISFYVDSTLAFGRWTDSITLHTETGQNPFFMGGDERLPLGVRVVCRPPDWSFNPALFENSENLIVELNIEGEVSTDVEDIVVAFINDEVRGRATVQYVPQVDKHLAFLTIFGNPDDILDPIRLEIWDASACLRYAVAEDDFIYQPDVVIGGPLTPQVLHTTSNVLREVPLGLGWNWLSFNLAFPNPALDSALASLEHPANDLIKGQSSFSLYFNNAGWFGSLAQLGHTSMYIYQADQPDTLLMMGAPLNPATTPIAVTPGWNWIGYIPTYSLPVNAALSSLPAQTGDLIKGQTTFAQYIDPTFGWIGNLKFMSPPNGYQVKLAAPGTLVYPPALPNNLAGPDLAADDRGPVPPAAASVLWTIDPTQYEHSMTLIGMLAADGANATTATMELGAFAGSQVRGSATALYIPPLDGYLFFLTAFANQSGEPLHFKLYDSATGAVHDLEESMTFSPDLHQGAIDDPVPFTLPVSAVTDAGAHVGAVQTLEVQPNPFRTETLLRFTLPDAADVRFTVTDLGGREVASWSTTAAAGLNTVRWYGTDADGRPLPAGAYFVRLQTPRGSVVAKVVRQ